MEEKKEEPVIIRKGGFLALDGKKLEIFGITATKKDNMWIIRSFSKNLLIVPPNKNSLVPKIIEEAIRKREFDKSEAIVINLGTFIQLFLQGKIKSYHIQEAQVKKDGVLVSDVIFNTSFGSIPCTLFAKAS